MKKHVQTFIIAVLCVSCTKEITVDLNSVSSQMVIEGSISDEIGYHAVKLSKTASFSEANTYPPVTGALVIISDNTGLIDTLVETNPGLYQTQFMAGIPGYTYTLSVFADNKQYEAVSTMPFKVNLDSIQFSSSGNPGSSENTFAIVPLFLDPEAFGNNYRFLFSANGVRDQSYQVTNDNIGNGSVNQQPFFSNNVEYFAGDTVKTTMLCIDVNTYNYYYTLSQIGDGGPGGGATPSNPPNNITGNKALGIFSAYTSQTITVVAE